MLPKAWSSVRSLVVNSSRASDLRLSGSKLGERRQGWVPWASTTAFCTWSRREVSPSSQDSRTLPPDLTLEPCGPSWLSPAVPGWGLFCFPMGFHFKVFL